MNNNHNQDLYDRMCKKISQLTRVIFVLNTKNDENEALIESIVDSYEKEIESLTIESNNILNSMKKTIDKAAETLNPEDKIKQIKKKYEDTLTQYNSEYEKYKKDTNHKLNKSIVEYNEKVEKMRGELNEVKKAYDIKLSEIQKRSEEDKYALKSELDKHKKNNSSLEEKLKDTFELHKKQLEKLRQDLRAEYKIEKDKLIAEYEKKIEDIKKLNDRDSSSNNKMLEEARNSYELKIKNLNEEINALKVKLTEEEKANNMNKDKIKSLESIIEQMKKENNVLDEYLFL